MPAILVPLDGSPLAEQTLSVGASFARRSGAELHLVRVIDPVPAPLLAGEGPQDATGIERELGAHAEGYLRWLAGATHAIQGLSVATAVLDRPVVPALCEYVQAHGIDLAVMTTHGRGGVRRWCLGSVATELLRRVTCPVLLLHDQELPQPTEFRRIVVALDGEVDRPVLEAAMALGSLDPQSQCFLTRVVEPAIPILTPLAARPAHLGPHENERREIVERAPGLVKAATLHGLHVDDVPGGIQGEVILDI